MPNEGRRGSREFDVQFYKAIHSDIRNAFGANHQAALDHWAADGLPFGGRRGSADFHAYFYVNHYPDLQAAFGTNYPAALDHWVAAGRNDGRQGIP